MDITVELLAQAESETLMSSPSDIAELLAKARGKAAGDSDLSRRSGISRATLWRLANGKLKTHARNETLGKLARFALGINDA